MVLPAGDSYKSHGQIVHLVQTVDTRNLYPETFSDHFKLKCNLEKESTCLNSYQPTITKLHIRKTPGRCLSPSCGPSLGQGPNHTELPFWRQHLSPRETLQQLEKKLVLCEPMLFLFII